MQERTGPTYRDNFSTRRARRQTQIDQRRRDEFTAENFGGRMAIHQYMLEQKADVLEPRRLLAADYLARTTGEIGVPRDRGAAKATLVDETHAARGEALDMAMDRASLVDNKSLEFPVLGRDFGPDSHCVALATSSLLLRPIVEYLGFLPVLFNMFVTRAHRTEFLPNSSHRFHLDPEDVLTHKVFVNLTPTDDDCGPLHVLTADKSRLVLDALDYRGIDRVEDHQVEELVGWDSVLKFDGPPGTVAFADTSRCLHFGGRPRSEGKPMRYTLVFQYLLPTSYLFPFRGAGVYPDFIAQLEATGDPTWDALIGASLIDG